MVMSRIWAAASLGLMMVASCSGDEGAAGAGGQPCSVKSNGDGTSTITCADGTTVIVPDGQPGDAGPPGDPGDPGEAGPPGDSGTSCTITDNGDGTKTISCSDGTKTVIPAALRDFATLNDVEKAGMDPTLTILDVEFPTDGKPIISMLITDRKGVPVKGMGALATGAGLTWRFSILKLAAKVNASGNDTWVSYIAANATSSASAENAASSMPAPANNGTLVDKGDGTYTYTFAKNITDEPNAGTKYEADKTHRVIALAYKSGNPFRPMDAWKDLVPQTGADVSGKNDKVNGASCLNCHSDWRAPANATGAFHAGTRYEPHVCVACHNDQRRFSSTGTALTEPTMTAGSTAGTYKWSGNASIINGEAVLNFPVFIHKIHMGHRLALIPDRAGGGGGYSAVQFDEVTYPQDVRSCQKCHNTVEKADSWKTGISRRACGACHDDISFSSGALPPGRKLHTGGALTDDAACTGCHSPTTAISAEKTHEPVAEPGVKTSGTIPYSPDGQYRATGFQWDPTLNAGKGGAKTCSAAAPCTCTTAAPCLDSANSNGAWLAATGFVPAGAAKITYDVKEVLIDATTKNPKIVFKLKKDGTDVDFGAYDATTKPELISGFVGSPSAYFAWSLPQDGIAAPDDFNASASVYIKSVWDGSVTTSELTKDATTGYYTLTIKSVALPSTARIVTGGIGYSYNMASTLPLTQIDVAKYPYDANTRIGGLIVPAPNVWKTATGQTARRPIVETERCNKCHDGLGVSPTFHSGQRNDAPTCSFCHTANRVNSGWSVNAKDIVHSIHGGGKRTVPFTWHGEIKAWDVTYPGVLNTCTQCHLDGTYDFSLAATKNAIPNMLYSTSAVGTTSTTPVAPATIAPFVSPYITPDTVDYGAGYATSNQTSGKRGGVTCKTTTVCVNNGDCASNVCNDFGAGGGGKLCLAQNCVCSMAAPCDADGTTLVKSPIVAACSACHDSAAALAHFAANNGSFWKPRSTALPTQETCLMCHGPSKIAAIAHVHR